MALRTSVGYLLTLHPRHTAYIECADGQWSWRFESVDDDGVIHDGPSKGGYAYTEQHRACVDACNHYNEYIQLKE